MKYRAASNMKHCICSLLLFLLFLANPAASAYGQATAAGLPAEEALRLGEAMYLKGVLPSGKPMRAVVQGDLELTGKMTTCANCHRRSGLGSLEGGVLTPPTNGAKLYAPLVHQQDIPGAFMNRTLFKNQRPAYTDESLANALLQGIDPSGRRLAATMPRYLLDEDATRLMISYLKSLSAEFSPGVTGDEIRFATVLHEGVSAEARDALLLPLKAYIQAEWNAQVSGLNARLSRFGRQTPGNIYRRVALDVWELKGPAGTWESQLEAFNRREPVFALLGGIVPGKWAPVHDFCEKNRIPCIFPFTDLPVVSGSGWYTLYFSKGLHQEGEAAAKYLSRVFALPPGKQIVQVFRDHDEGNALAGGFADTWKKLGNASLTNRSLAAAEKTGGKFWQGLAAAHPNAVILLWLGPADLAGIEALAHAGSRPSTLFVSATMLAGAVTAIPDKVRDFTYLTYPTRLPGDEEYSRSIVALWMKFKKVPLADMTISAKAYFLTRMLSYALSDLRGDIYRDFFLDILDDGKDQATASVTYPMLSFGPGQRYAAKGCYVVTLTKGENPKVVRQSDWIIY